VENSRRCGTLILPKSSTLGRRMAIYFEAKYTFSEQKIQRSG
jgi:hypothetical protein